MKPKPSPNNSALALLAAINAGKIETVVPDGWYSARELAQLTGWSVSGMQKQLGKGLANGIVETRKFRPTGCSCPTPFYHTIDK